MTRSCTPGIKIPSWIQGWQYNKRSTGLKTARRLLSEHPASQLEGPLGVRRVEDARQVGPSRFGQYRLAVAELIEAPLAVVGTHARRADAAERQLGGRHLEG